MTFLIAGSLILFLYGATFPLLFLLRRKVDGQSLAGAGAHPSVRATARGPSWLLAHQPIRPRLVQPCRELAAPGELAGVEFRCEWAS